MGLNAGSLPELVRQPQVVRWDPRMAPMRWNFCGSQEVASIGFRRDG